MPATPPVPTARSTPSAYRLPDGFSTKITMATQPAVAFWERKVKPPGIDGGEMIDISTMFNTKWLTFFPRVLIKLDDVAVEAGYNPSVLPTIVTMTNLQDTCTITYPDSSTDCFYACLRKFEQTDMVHGEFPMANITISPTNLDASFNEEGPVFAAGSGTPP